MSTQRPNRYDYGVPTACYVQKTKYEKADTISLFVFCAKGLRVRTFLLRIYSAKLFRPQSSGKICAQSLVYFRLCDRFQTEIPTEEFVLAAFRSVDCFTKTRNKRVRVVICFFFSHNITQQLYQPTTLRQTNCSKILDLRFPVTRI